MYRYFADRSDEIRKRFTADRMTPSPGHGSSRWRSRSRRRPAGSSGRRTATLVRENVRRFAAGEDLANRVV
ncbi:hypothetical protein BRC95_02960 [Halobacteriales archaeon QS_5_68_33]|nr:MAG: hypothetical protein BRC95_02960 [Halobacteriales archaeon QS_5_68_33]